MTSYSSELTDGSPQFTRYGDYHQGDYYYQVIRVDVSRAGSYLFRGRGNLSPYGYLYNRSFQPIRPETNLITYTDGSNYGSFVLRADLNVSTLYYLVVSTLEPDTVGAFNLTITGVAQVNLTKQNCEFYSAKCSISLPSYE
jgi:hypothetical protein